MIFILTDLYFPETTSTGYFITKIAEGLGDNYDIKVITGNATKSLIPVQNYSRHEIKNKVEIWRCQGIKFNHNNLIFRFFNFLNSSLVIFYKTLLLCRHGDVILSVTHSPLLPFFALLLKIIKRVDFVVLIYDIYPEVLVVTGLCKSSSMIVKIGQRMNHILYQEASIIITLGRDMTRRLELQLSQKNQTNYDKIVCIPHWADCEIIHPINRENNSLLKKLNLLEKFVILYAGNLGRTHGIEDIVEAAKSLSLKSDIHFIISGFGFKKAWLEKTVIENKLNNITLLNPCQQSELNTLLNACDIAIIALIPGMTGISVPSRLYNQMAAGKPIIAIADEDSELATVIQEEQIGWIVNPGDITYLIKIIQVAQNDVELCFTMGEKAAQSAKKKYTFSQTIRAYKKVMGSLNVQQR